MPLQSAAVQEALQKRREEAVALGSAQQGATVAEIKKSAVKMEWLPYLTLLAQTESATKTKLRIAK